MRKDGPSATFVAAGPRDRSFIIRRLSIPLVGDARMRHAGWKFGILALGALAACGCSRSASEGEGQASQEKTAAKVPGPDKALFDFLEAVRTGDDAKAADMLTDLARSETEKYELVVAPAGSDTASFKVGEVEIVAEGGAHVASVWTDVGEDGQPDSHEIIWMLRREPKGWRIAGMATKLSPEDKLPVLLNFEDPKEMIRNQRLADEEMQRRAKAAAQQAARPDTTDPSAKTRKQ
jgi:hypothetical protein